MPFSKFSSIQERTASVIKESMNSIKNIREEKKQWAFNKVVASGMSSNLILNNQGEEDQLLSRRLKFKYLIDSEMQVENIKKIIN